MIGGRTFVWPILQQGFSISLEQRQIGITVEGVDKNRIKIAIKASINFKVSGTEDGVRRAAQRFLSQQELLTEIIKESLEGSLRSIVGDMTIEQIISDRKSLSDRVVAETKTDLVEQGLQVDLLNISDISTPGSDYLANLGRAEAARARQVAEVSEAEAARASEFARIEAAEQIAERQKALNLKQAVIKAETDRANAEAAAAGQLAKAEQDKLVAVQERDALAGAGARDAGATRHRDPQARRGRRLRGGAARDRAARRRERRDRSRRVQAHEDRRGEQGRGRAGRRGRGQRRALRRRGRARPPGRARRRYPRRGRGARRRHRRPRASRMPPRPTRRRSP